MAKRGLFFFTGVLISIASIAHVAPKASDEAAPNPQEEVIEVIQQTDKKVATVRLVPQIATVSQVHASAEEKETLLPVVDQPDIREEDKKVLDAALKWFPALCRENLKHLVIRYNPDAERALASSSTIILRSGMPKQELIAVLFHECGHVIDLGALKGTANSGESVYPDGHVPIYWNDPSVSFYAISWETNKKKRRSARSADFVSGYAKADVFEDLSETLIYYAFHNKAFRERANSNVALAQKYHWMRDNIFGPEFVPFEGKSWNGEVVWDITKMKHDLHL